MGAGSIKIQAPRVNDRRPEHTFHSRILPPYMRRSPRLEEAVPVLYLRGLSTGDFSEALEALLGSEATGFSATTITRLVNVWQEEYKAWRKRSLAGKEYVYIWADGVYFNIRLEEDRLACLVIVGVLPDGRKEVIACHLSGYTGPHVFTHSGPPVFTQTGPPVFTEGGPLVFTQTGPG
jgi:transposase-like protein